MKRRILALFSATALVAAAAAGCSSSGSAPAASAASGGPGSASFGVNATGTVQFWARNVSKTLAQKLTSEFNASHSKLKVRPRYPTGRTRRVSGLSACRFHAPRP